MRRDHAQPTQPGAPPACRHGRPPSTPTPKKVRDARALLVDQEAEKWLSRWGGGFEPGGGVLGGAAGDGMQDVHRGRGSTGQGPSSLPPKTRLSTRLRYPPASWSRGRRCAQPRRTVRGLGWGWGFGGWGRVVLPLVRASDCGNPPQANPTPHPKTPSRQALFSSVRAPRGARRAAGRSSLPGPQRTGWGRCSVASRGRAACRLRVSLPAHPATQPPSHTHPPKPPTPRTPTS